MTHIFKRASARLIAASIAAGVSATIGGALAIGADGTKLPVGLWDGSTENKTVVRALLADLVERSLIDAINTDFCNEHAVGTTTTR